MAGNGNVLLQAFHWYLPNDGTLWRAMTERAPALAAAGFGGVWLPPASKGHVGGYDVGYGPYDLYDLGEFDQKGTVRTKYGTRDEYLTAVGALQRAGLRVFADMVWNHRLGADGAEVVRATPHAADDRHHALGPTREVEVWTRFDFAGRAGRYDARTLDARHFVAVDFDGRDPQSNAIYLFEGKAFDPSVDEEFGNYHYLMGCDLDHGNAEVRAMTVDWGRWFLDTTGVDGLRLDAVKHLPTWVLPIYLDALRQHVATTRPDRPELPVVGEYWSGNLPALLHFLRATGDRLALFDVPLHFAFHRMGQQGADFDLRTLFHDTLVAARPDLAVTFVDNHDSQPMQALESPVADWAKPLAYALLLLRRAGQPCVFGADYDGATYTEQRWGEPPVEVVIPTMRPFLDTCLALRRQLGDATQEDHFDHPNVVGWVRRSDDLLVVVLMSNGGPGHARIATGVPDLQLVDATAADPGPIRTDEQGAADVRCAGRGVSVWVGRIVSPTRPS
jgi:alpha-amylase